MKRLAVLLVWSLVLLVGCRSTEPATIRGVVFRDLNANGIRDVHDPGQPDIVVSAYDADNNFVISTTTDINGEYILNRELDSTKIIAGESYCVMFENIPPPLSSGPVGPDSGTDIQFVKGGDTNVSYGLFSPEQYVPDNFQP